LNVACHRLLVVCDRSSRHAFACDTTLFSCVEHISSNQRHCNFQIFVFPCDSVEVRKPCRVCYLDILVSSIQRKRKSQRSQFINNIVFFVNLLSIGCSSLVCVVFNLCYFINRQCFKKKLSLSRTVSCFDYFIDIQKIDIRDSFDHTNRRFDQVSKQCIIRCNRYSQDCFCVCQRFCKICFVSDCHIFDL
jgi:hypothetical protein